MEAEPLAPRGQTPFSPGPFQLDSGVEGVVCGSGDRFVTATDPWLLQHGVEVVDMELFAIASVCQREGIPWRSFKYIADHANRDSGTSWQAHVRGGAGLISEAGWGVGDGAQMKRTFARMRGAMNIHP
jgi:adenosylhomocysteine nucleosidase